MLSLGAQSPDTTIVRLAPTTEFELLAHERIL
jgi:hypothetical protein